MADKTRKRVLLAGESWVTTATHIKGFDQFTSATFHLGAERLVAALSESAFELTYLPSHQAAADFPTTLTGLQQYGAVMLSDIGANTLLLHPDVWLHGKTVPNRLKLIRDYVRAGGGLVMIGGYYSFQGINGGARYRGTPVEEVLPVTILPHDDRVEVPEGCTAEVVDPQHPITKGLGKSWPPLLGFNEVIPKDGRGIELLARAPRDQGGHPLLVAGRYGSGRTVAWTSDIGPHWVSAAFAKWPGFNRLWRQLLAWLVQDS
jgi:uncharacterized membrane protein